MADELAYKSSPLYLSGTPQEQKWFDLFFETRDVTKSTLGSYRIANENDARSYGRQVMARKHIAALLEQYCETEKPLPTVEDLRRRYIKIADSPSATPRDQLSALTAYERLSGFTKISKPSHEEDDPLDDIKDE